MADFVVLDRNPFAVPITQVHATKVLEKWIGGERVYSTGDRQVQSALTSR
ncbi:MAG: hypothetical protein IT551_04805 [Novosphingobium sp.]|nr:hypothetical protein [Novosphingobium sp.]